MNNLPVDQRHLSFVRQSGLRSYDIKPDRPSWKLRAGRIAFFCIPAIVFAIVWLVL